jgi:hypothetical protein
MGYTNPATLLQPRTDLTRQLPTVSTASASPAGKSLGELGNAFAGTMPQREKRSRPDANKDSGPREHRRVAAKQGPL